MFASLLHSDLFCHALICCERLEVTVLCVFPSGISTSFEGKHGSIRYWLKAEMDKPWSFNHKTKKAFTVISPIDINRPEYQVGGGTQGRGSLPLAS